MLQLSGHPGLCYFSSDKERLVLEKENVTSSQRRGINTWRCREKAECSSTFVSCLSACVCVCTYVCLCVYICVQRVCACACICVCSCACLYNVCMSVPHVYPVCTHVCMYTYALCMYVYVSLMLPGFCSIAVGQSNNKLPLSY